MGRPGFCDCTESFPEFPRRLEISCPCRVMLKAGLELAPALTPSPPASVPLRATKATLLSPGTALISDSSRDAQGKINIFKNFF